MLAAFAAGAAFSVVNEIAEEAFSARMAEKKTGRIMHNNNAPNGEICEGLDFLNFKSKILNLKIYVFAEGEYLYKI